MDNEVNELLKKVNHKCVVYRTGSKLTKVNFKDSDSDFYVFYLPSKYEFLSDRDQGKTYHGETWEAKVFNTAHLFSLLKKTNPNLIEIFFAKPVFVSPELKLFSDFVYLHREDLVNVDRKHFVKSAYGMIKSNVSRMSPDKKFLGTGTFGKESYNLLKAYDYGKAVALGEPLENHVFKTGDALTRVRELKAQSKYSQSVMDSLQVDKKLDELEKLLQTTEDKTDEQLLKDLVDKLPVFA